MHTDPISDLLTRLRNAQHAHRVTLIAPYSKMKEELLKVMKEKGYIEDYKVTGEGVQKELSVTLKENNSLTFRRVSKPGQRIYIKKDEIKPIKSGLGISIISTSKGLITNIEAKKLDVGGELICEIY